MLVYFKRRYIQHYLHTFSSMKAWLYFEENELITVGCINLRDLLLLVVALVPAPSGSWSSSTQRFFDRDFEPSARQALNEL